MLLCIAGLKFSNALPNNPYIVISELVKLKSKNGTLPQNVSILIQLTLPEF